MRWGKGRRRVAAWFVVCGLGISGALVPQAAYSTAVSSAGPSAPLSPPEGTIPDLAALEWQPVFDEQFDGSAVDESVWSILQDDPHPADGLHTRDTVSVDGSGHLQMSTYTDSAGTDHASALATGGIGDLNPTPGGFDAAYGYIEASLNFPDGPGTGSTFWAMSNNGNGLPFGDPAVAGPELDIVEHANLPATGWYSGDFNGDGRCDWPAGATLPCKETFIAGGHWDGVEEDHKAMHEVTVENPNPAVSLEGTFHTYGVLWTPEEYRYFVDGIEVKRVTTAQSFSPQHLVLQTYIIDHGAAEYGPLGSAGNDVTLVDYVKVWQRPVSEVPDQSTAVNTPLSVPFTVQDYAYGSDSRAEPGSVTVSAVSWSPTLVPNTPAGLAVSGNGPTDPDGSFTNGGFEGSDGWAYGAGAIVWTGKKQTGNRSLWLTQGGGRAAQTLTGLKPDTTYLVGAHYDIDLGYGDTNANGRVDPAETFTESGDGTARFDWGISDVDSALPGPQAVRTSYTRNGWTEQASFPWQLRQAWPHEFVKFTTGPSTTSVELFFDNTAYAGSQDDSDVAIDSVYVRPVVNPQRTLAVHPVDGRAGDAIISLVARDPSGRGLGSETFVLHVGAGSLRDGSFEARRATTPWVMSPTTKVVVPDPFRVDHQLQLASTTYDTVSQNVTSLAAGARYRLEVTGRVDRAGGELGAYVLHHDGGSTPVGTVIDSTSSETVAVEFVTAPGVTSADVVLTDWDFGDGSSFLERASLRKCAAVDSCDQLVTTHSWGNLLNLATIGAQRSVSGTPLSIGANLPAGSTLTGVTSTNPVLVPSSGIVTTGTGSRRAFTVTPVQGHTGKASIRVAYTGAPGSPVDIPVVVSDPALQQPGFEQADGSWALAGTAARVTAGPHGGAGALRVDGAGDARQTLVGLPHASGYVLGAWVDGTATVTLRTTPTNPGEQAETLASVNLTGSGWTEQKVPFTTLQCSDCTPEQWVRVEAVISDTNPGDGVPVKVDDLWLAYEPVIRRIRDLSLDAMQTQWDWETRRTISVGRVAENAIWDAAVRSITTSDVPGFGTGVVPAANVRGPGVPESGWPFSWTIDVKAGAKTGRSNVNVTLSDPVTGNQATETYAVTVNAGDNFNDGDFQRSKVGPVGAVPTGWVQAWFNDSHEIVRRQGWQYLGVRSTNWPYVGPRDDDQVLRLSSGAVKHVITGLAPDTQYRVRLQAKGDGSTVEVRAGDAIVDAPVLGSVAVAPPNGDNVWRDYTFTFTTAASGEGSDSVVLFLKDADMTGAAVPASIRPCAIYAAGESCFDDIGVFRVSDVG